MPKVYNVTTLTKPKIDFLSIVLSTIAFGSIIYGLSTISEDSTLATIIIVVGIVALLLFIWRQLTSKHPMIDLQVFKYRNFTIGSVLIFIVFSLLLAIAILMPLYLKGSLLLSATNAGLAMLLGNILNAVFAPIVGKTFDRVGPKFYLRFGFLCLVISTSILFFVISATTPLWLVIVSCMIFYVGVSTTIIPAQTNALNDLPKKLYSHGSAVINTLQQIAGAAGTALAITLMTTRQHSYTVEHSTATPETLVAVGTQFAFGAIVIVAVIGLLLAFFVRRPENN
ncbi:Major Facilitator Superfamily protein [Lysinibacillus sp. AC-3]|nr:Major Facilitator Superfamily protein [Lysinibacillus sp. AC-3]